MAGAELDAKWQEMLLDPDIASVPFTSKRPSPETDPPFREREHPEAQWHVLPEGTCKLPETVRAEPKVVSPDAMSNPPDETAMAPDPLTSQEDRVSEPPLATDNRPLLPNQSEPDDHVAPEAKQLIAPFALNCPPFDASMFPLTQLNELQVSVEPAKIKTGLAVNDPKVIELTVIEEGIVSWQFVAKTTSESAEGTSPPAHARGSPQFAFPDERREIVAEDTSGRRKQRTSAYDRKRIVQDGYVRVQNGNERIRERTSPKTQGIKQNTAHTHTTQTDADTTETTRSWCSQTDRQQRT